jgi:hypothetical protein
MPIATIIALLAGTAIIIVLSIIIPKQAIQIVDVFINAKIVFLVLFIVIFSITAVIVKFYSEGLMKLSKGISWPPICFIIAIFCLLQGFALLAGGVSIIPV